MKTPFVTSWLLVSLSSSLLLSGCRNQSQPLEATSSPRQISAPDALSRTSPAPSPVPTPIAESLLSPEVDPDETTSSEDLTTTATQEEQASHNLPPQPTPTPPVAYNPDLPSDTRPIIYKDEFRGAYAISMNGREVLFNAVDDTYTPLGILGAVQSVRMIFPGPDGPITVSFTADAQRNTYVAELPDSIPDGAEGVLEYVLSENLTTGPIIIPSGVSPAQ